MFLYFYYYCCFRLSIIRHLTDNYSSNISKNKVPVTPEPCGAKRDRTVNLRLARAALSQLSYSPLIKIIKGRSVQQKTKRITLNVGLSGVEPLTSRLSGVRSNQLSYRPIWFNFENSL